MEKQELSELSLPLWDKLRRAVREGDTAKVLALIDEAQESFKRNRGNAGRFVNLALSVLARKAGEDAVEEVVRTWVHETVWPIFGKDTADMSAEDKVRRRAKVCTSLHGVGVDIEEDAEKFTLRFNCSSGGVAVKDESGRFKEAHAWACGEQGVSYYCAHCLLAFEVMAIERVGHPWWIVLPPKEFGEPCVQYIYKDTAKIPKAHPTRAASNKPAET